VSFLVAKGKEKNRQFIFFGVRYIGQEVHMYSESDQLITRYIEQNPYRPGEDDARLVDYGVPVWALAAHLRALNWNISQVATEYNLPKEAVEAALAYYQKHQDLIDARIEANEVPDARGTPVVFDVA
jgi:uncharacterized protein (DUF433 family)